MRRRFLVPLLVLVCAAVALAIWLCCTGLQSGKPDLGLSPAASHITVRRGIFYSSDESKEPLGYLITLNGAVNLTFLATQEIEEQPRDLLPIIQGQTIRTDEYDWTGLKTRINYVKSDRQLQIVREIEAQDENATDTESTDLPTEVLMTTSIPPGATFDFQDLKQ